MNEKNLFLKRIIPVVLLFSCAVFMVGCKKKSKKNGYETNSNLDTSEDITLRIASQKSTWEEMDAVVSKFEKIYPNCSISIEYVENYYENIDTRLSQTEEKMDIFRTTAIQADTIWKDNAYNLLSEDAKKTLDLSNCNEGLVNNFKYLNTTDTIYAVPFGGEMRGMYVNVTILDKYNLDIPTNKTELLNCCQVLLDNGYVPLQSHYGTFGQQLLYPSICNTVVNGGNYTEMFQKIQNLDVGISEYFREEFEFLYDIVEKGYYNSNKVDTELGYKFEGSEGKARDFLNIVKNSMETYEKKDDIGKIPFLIDTQGFSTYLDTLKSDYHSEIEYKFIVSPVSDEGGFAYLSPADGLAINKNSDNLEWALEFLNYFFTPEINTIFAEESGKIPNTKDALLKYDIDENQTCDVGQMTFEGFNFYKTITPLLLSGYSDGYTSVNANYRSVYPDETYYKKVLGTYRLASKSYIEENPESKIYRFDEAKYVEVVGSYILDNPDETYFYKEADYYEAVDSNFITNNPDEKIYRKVEAMVAISRMNNEKYMVKDENDQYKFKFSLDDYMARLEKEFQIVKATRDGAA